MERKFTKNLLLIFFCVFVAVVFWCYPASADFSPSDISNLKLWLDASQGVTTDGSTPAVDGNTVQQWNDQSASAANATQITPASKPTYKTNILNGKPVMRFGGAQSMATALFLNSTYNTSFTFFIVDNKSDSGFYLSTSNNGQAFYSSRESGDLLYTTNSLSTAQRRVYPVAPSVATDVGIETFRYNGATETLKFDDITTGATFLRVAQNSNNLNLNGTLSVGQYSSGGFNWKGDIAEIIIYNKALTDTELTQVGQYLETKYATNPVTIPSPGLNLPQVVFDGDSMTYGIGSTNGQDYPAQTISLLGGASSFRYTNNGKSGITVQTMITNAPTAVDVLYGSYRPYNILSFWGGTNDLYFGADATTTYNRIVSYLQGRRTAGFKVIVNTILPRSGGTTPSSFETDRQTVNGLIRANWPTFADGISDIASNSTIGPAGAELNTTYYADRVHMTNAGYGIVASYVKTQIENLMDGDAPVTTASPIGGTYGAARTITLACDDGSGSGCASIHYSTNGTDWFVYSTPVLISSTSTLYFYSVDNNGNSETPKTETYTIDTTGPTGSINNDSGNPTNDPTPTFNLTIADAGVGIAGAQMRFSGNNSTWSSWEPYAATKTNFNTNTGEGCSNADGTKNIYVQFKDSFDNIGSAYNTGNFTLDTTSSNAALSNTPATHGIYTPSTSANIIVGGTDVVSYKYKLDSGSYGEETLIATHLTLSGLAEGSHTLSVIGKDSVGNWQSEDDATSYSWTIDTHAPTRSDKSPSGELPSGAASATLTLTTNEVATCKYDTTSKDYGDMDNSFTTPDGLSHSAGLSGLTDGGSYQYYVRCQDTAENANDTDYLISFSVASAENTDGNTDEDNDNSTNENSNDDSNSGNNNEKDLNVHSVKAQSSENTITITWKTDHNTKSSVRYGADKDLKQKEKDKEKEKKHKIVLKGLLPDTKYYFRIKAEDSDDNQDSSRIHSIVTKSVPTSNPIPSRSSDENTDQAPTGNAPAPINSEDTNPNVCAYTVESGDSLWSIAKKVYGDATAYPQIIEKNKDKYPDIESKLSIGQELTFDCKNNTDTNTPSQQVQGAEAQEPQETSNFKWYNPFSWF